MKNIVVSSYCNYKTDFEIHCGIQSTFLVYLVVYCSLELTRKYARSGVRFVVDLEYNLEADSERIFRFSIRN